jgi:hypothetical protein
VYKAKEREKRIEGKGKNKKVRRQKLGNRNQNTGR